MSTSPSTSTAPRPSGSRARTSLFFAGDCGPLLDAIEGFVTGELPTHATDRVLATVMFTDIVGSTEHTARIGDRRWKELMGAHDAAVRTELGRWRGREIKSTGDGVLATFDGPGRALRCAAAIRDSVRSLGVEVRIGVHTGEIEQRGDDIEGIAVVIAKRVEALAAPGAVLVTRTVVDLVAGLRYRVHRLRRPRTQGRARGLAPLPGWLARPHRTA